MTTMTTTTTTAIRDEILTDPALVFGEIYVMTNNKTKMEYVGQAASHRLNHGKYRPHGSRGRFTDHIGEALRNTRNKTGSLSLNNAIRDHGAEAFTFVVIRTCPVLELDQWEAHYINERGTLHPNGYNLREGGNRTKVVKHEVENNGVQVEPRDRGGRTAAHSDATKQLMSARLKNLHASGALTDKFSSKAKDQHSATRLAAFASVAHLIDADRDLSEYVKERRSKADGSLVFCHVSLGDKKTRFWPQGNHDITTDPSTDTTTDPRQEALDFLMKLKAIACDTTKLRETPESPELPLPVGESPGEEPGESRPQR